MGNSLTNECSSVCGINFLTSQDLRSTTLQKCEIRRLKTKSHTAEIEKPHHDLGLEPKDEKKSKVKSTGDIPVRGLEVKRSNTCHLSLKDLDKKHVSNENDFRVLQVLGHSHYGKICLVKRYNCQQIFIMKIICKKKLPHGSNSISIEKEILEKAHNPFIPKLSYSFENNKNLFLVTEYVEGVNFQHILKQLNRFSEEITRFYSAEILLALDYLHKRLHMAYNDLKIENIILDSEGHIKILEYEYAQHLDSPKNHSSNDDFVFHSTESSHEPLKMTDFWGFGCLVYEFLTGKKPKEEDLEGNLELPSFVSKTAKDLITRLLNPKAEERLGYNGIKEIQNHQFFAHINWGKLLQKAVYPPLNSTQFQKKIEEEEDEDETETESDCESSAKCSINLMSELEENKTNHLYNKIKNVSCRDMLAFKDTKGNWNVNKHLRE